MKTISSLVDYYVPTNATKHIVTAGALKSGRTTYFARSNGIQQVKKAVSVTYRAYIFALITGHESRIFISPHCVRSSVACLAEPHFL
jgi:hypothetical protein